MIVGCPVRSRAWSMPAWKEALDVAAAVAKVKPELLFVVGADDDETWTALDDWEATIYPIVEPVRGDVRDWCSSRYEHMVDIRNRLLTQVRAEKPDFFLSLDSDMMLHPNALKALLESYDQFYDHGGWAIGGGTYMTTAGTDCPSYGRWREPAQHQMGFYRKEAVGQQAVDIIMGIKLMDPRAYNIDYHFHSQGEDLGWSEAVTAAGGKLWWDGRNMSKHCLEPEMLNKVDYRVGF